MTRKASHTKTVLVLCGMMGAMSGLVIYSPTLYEMFCNITGYGGTPRVVSDMEAAEAAATAGAQDQRMVTVRFNAETQPDLPWRFEPVERRISVPMGEATLAFYRATNVSDRPVTGQATFNVTPPKAGLYFSKTECFCFTEQTLQPGESVDMPVSFFIDPEMAQDRNTNDVTHVTLSYTFFRALSDPADDTPKPITKKLRDPSERGKRES